MHLNISARLWIFNPIAFTVCYIIYVGNQRFGRYLKRTVSMVVVVVVYKCIIFYPSYIENLLFIK